MIERRQLARHTHRIVRMGVPRGFEALHVHGPQEPRRPAIHPLRREECDHLGARAVRALPVRHVEDSLGPGEAVAESVIHGLDQAAFEGNDFNLASAVAVVLFFLVLGLTLINFRVFLGHEFGGSERGGT